MQTINYTTNMPASEVVSGPAICVRFPYRPSRYYRHGWQSWSLTTWTDTSHELPIPGPRLLHPMQHDPFYALRPGHHGSWVGAVETDANKVLLLGSLQSDAHAVLEDHVLTGTYETGTGDWLIAFGDERDVFDAYARALGARFGARAHKPSPRVWCSWYSLFTAIDEVTFSRVIDDIADLPFDVLQVDDGWQLAAGDWKPNGRFPSGMAALAEGIKSSGRVAGLWIAPLIAARSSQLFHEHPDWLLHDAQGKYVSAGFNWGDDLLALDTTHPQAQAWLAELLQQVRDWGFDYVKLDFLYGGALPGRRHQDVPREAAYRAAMQIMSDALGSDCFILACGAPIIPSLGLCDALRIGPDASPHWESWRDAVLLHNPCTPGTRNAIRTSLHRLWLQPLARLDPDVAYFRTIDCRLTPEQKHLLQALALICNFRATSDLPQSLTPTERASLKQFLLSSPRVEQSGPRGFTIDGDRLDYESAVRLPETTPLGFESMLSALAGWAGNQRPILRMVDKLAKRALAKRLSGIK